MILKIDKGIKAANNLWFYKKSYSLITVTPTLKIE